MSENMSQEQFALHLVEACKSPDIQQMLKNVMSPIQDELADRICAEVYRQTLSLRKVIEDKDKEINQLKKTVNEQKVKLDDLEQHGRRDSLRISGIPENPDHDDTDAAVLQVCEMIKIQPPVQPEDIAVSHRVGKPTQKGPRQIIVKFATRNIRERVFSAKKKLKRVNRSDDDDNSGGETSPKNYLNEDLTQFRAGLAREARFCKNAGLIADTWTIYGKIMIKDNHGHISIIRTPDDLAEFKPRETATIAPGDDA